MHRQAARLDDRYELVAAALSSDPERARLGGQDIGVSPERSYPSGQALIDAEAQREDGAEVVAIMTPNDSHYVFAMQALERGMDVICDKPMTNTLEEAQALHAKAQVEYVQGNRSKAGPSKSAWKDDPARGGPSLVLGAIGTHAHNLLCFMTDLDVAEVAAEIGSIVPERVTHDYAGALLRMSNGARGSFWITQAATGVENSLRIRISGELGTLEWNQEHPQVLQFKPLDAPAQVRTPNGPGTLPLSARASRIVAGHPEGFHEAFANLYSNAADAITARRSGQVADPLSLYFPNSHDGLQSLRFVAATVASSANQGAWTAL
jgi:predicted dehydrogenase